MKMLKKKKGNVTIAIWGILILLAGFVGSFAMGWLPFQQAVDEPTGATGVPASQKDELASFKVSVEDDGDNPSRYAGTVYCYDITAPTELIGGGSVTLSATAATAVSPVNKGQTLKCIAFDSNHLGILKQKTITKEGDQLILSSKNISGAAAGWEYTIYEDGSADSGKAITISAGATDTFDKVILQSQYSDSGFNFKELCLNSNKTSSEVSAIEIGGWSAQSRTPYAIRNSADFCFKLDKPEFVRDYGKLTLGQIKISTTASFAEDENMTFTFLDEAPFEKVLGGIGFDIQDDTTTPATTGATDITSSDFSFRITTSS